MIIIFAIMAIGGFYVYRKYGKKNYEISE